MKSKKCEHYSGIDANHKEFCSCHQTKSKVERKKELKKLIEMFNCCEKARYAKEYPFSYCPEHNNMTNKIKETIKKWDKKFNETFTENYGVIVSQIPHRDIKSYIAQRDKAILDSVLEQSERYCHKDIHESSNWKMKSEERVIHLSDLTKIIKENIKL